MQHQDQLYAEAATEFGQAISRLARAYEADTELRRDLQQEIHAALWRSLESFDRRCSLRTWVYRVAHNVATSHVIRNRRMRAHEFASIEAIESAVCDPVTEAELDEKRALERLMHLIQQLKPIDRQVMVLYLEGLDGAAIGEITGISAVNAATKIHRIKAILARRFHEREAGAQI